MTMQTLKSKFGRNSHLNSPSASPVMQEPDEIFTFNHTRPTSTVHVENLPSHLKKLEIVSLFHTLIGEVRSFQEINNTANARLEITFADYDTATKALCMNGYTLGGVPLKVSAHPGILNSTRSNKLDDRRNLYVLGLPFALNKSEFAALFAQYGTVSHCVILATVDNSSRRRGFIVMSTHEEAKNAMSALTRTHIKGHTIDVSWAVVQRSQGFLDGGDRAMILESRIHVPCPVNPRTSDRSTSSPDVSASPVIDPTFLLTSALPTTSLLVNNLPTLLFSQVQDLRPLFFPFGQIDKLDIVHASSLGSISVIVQYSTTTSAQEAKESLNGQLYGSFRIEACYVSPWGMPNINSKIPTNNWRPPIERSMTDSLPHSVPRTCRAAQLTSTVSKVTLPTKDMAISPRGTIGRHDFFALPESSHTTLSVPPLTLPGTTNGLDEFDLGLSSYWSLDVLPTTDWSHFRSNLRPLSSGFTNSQSTNLDTLYQSSDR